MANLKQDFEHSFSNDRVSFNILLFKAMKYADKYYLEIMKVAFPDHYKIFNAWKEFGVDHSNSDLIYTESQVGNTP